MTEPRDDEREARIAERAARLAGRRPRGGVGRIVLGAGLAAAFVALSALLLAPQEVGRLLGATTSTAQPLQSASRVDPGISTAITREDPPPEIAVPPAPELAALRPPAEPEPDRLGELERLVKELGDRPDSLDADALAALLDEQAARMREEFERQRALERELFDEQLAAARRSQVETVNAGLIGGQVDAAEADRRAREEEERARLAAIEAEQIGSDSMVFDESAPRRASGPGAGPEGAVRRLNGNEAFLASAGAQGVETSRAARLEDPSRTIVQGSVLEATLETAIDTDMPGIIRAVLSVDAWSYDGTALLLPQGSRLIGTYSSDVSVAQRRALIAWTRAITPAGESIMLGSIGADALGRSGQTGDVDTRFLERFGSAALISVIGAAPIAIASDGGAEGEVAEDVAGDFRGATRSALDDYLRIKPTIRIDQGTRMTVLVNRDLVF